MTIEAETFLLGKSIWMRKLKPGTILTSEEMERLDTPRPYVEKSEIIS